LSEEEEVALTFVRSNVKAGGQFPEKKTTRQGRKSANFLELKSRFETLTKKSK